MAQAIPAVIGGLGLFSQNNANRQAQSDESQQLALQRQLIAQQEQERQAYQNVVNGETQAGAFNPDMAIKQADNSRSYQEQQSLGNDAAAAKALGYRPGDTAPLEQIGATQGAYNLAAGQQDQGLRQQAYANQLAAQEPLIGNTGPGIAATGENARMFNGNYEPVDGMLRALAPYLEGIVRPTSPGAPYSYGNGQAGVSAAMNSAGPDGNFGVNSMGGDPFMTGAAPGSAPPLYPGLAQAETTQLSQSPAMTQNATGAWTPPQQPAQARPLPAPPIQQPKLRQPVTYDTQPGTYASRGGYQQRPTFRLPPPTFSSVGQ